MGLLTRLGSIFSRHPGAPANPEAPDQASPPGFDDAHDAEIVEEHPLEALEELADASVVTTRQVNLARPLTRRTKQEWFDELQRNHQELTDLIRKFDSHLDREAERADRIVRAAEALDLVVPAIERLAERMGDRVDDAATRITGSVEVSSRRAEMHASESGKSLEEITGHLRTSASGQTELVTRLAEFRQTMSDMARAGSESTRLLAEMSARDTTRQEQLERRIASTRAWIIVGVCAAMAIGVSAIAVAVIAITRTS
ncbi:MAG: hypothetical protein H6812_09700 [Phycisphaeraceae bacterium]|nr:hypothetical protein [Phycisphaerales bacterium]MCB9843517.1 hypothetical protein [Phycisphaeraceae bacterium]